MKKTTSFLTVGLALLVVLFSFRLVQVEGNSMEPLLQNGDWLVVETLTRRFVPPMRGEVFVTENPHATERTVVKRIIGLPEEEVVLSNEMLIITNGDGTEERFGADSSIGSRANGSPDTMQLGPEDYYMLGDNRDESTDSRSFGAVQPVNFIGRPVVRVWPLSHIELLIGASRL